MSKKIRSFWRLMLGSLISLTGFAACKTTKKVQQGDQMRLLYGPPPSVVDKKTPVDRVYVLYGGPPVKVEKIEKVEQPTSPE